MTILQSIILGIIQGATEFLPISSSAHLVLMPHLLGWDIPAQDAFVFDVLVQVATLIAVFAYYWNDLIDILRATGHGIRHKRPFADPQAKMGLYIILATIPAGLAGLVFSETFERAFGSPKATSLFLLGTAGLLLIAERAGKRSRSSEDISWKDALWIGVFQILALFPGISRSGATITGGMLKDLNRPTAARFSFLMSIPIMLAAGLIATLRLAQLPYAFTLLPTYLAGFITAATVGYLSIRWLIKFLTQRPLYIFAIYCTIFAGINLLIIAIQT